MTILKKLAFTLFATVFCVALLGNPILAQTITATLTGTIADPNGAIVPGATVSVTSVETGQTKTDTTNQDGRYTITFLPPGTYNVSVESAGFTRATRENIRLEVAQTASIDFALSVTGGEVKVDIGSDETPILQTETSNLETTIEQKLVEDLPSVDRNIFSFVNLVPGTIDAGTALGNAGAAVGSAGNRNFFDSNFSVGGGRASSNDVLLDGVTNTIGDFNGVAVSPPQDSIREFKVISGIAPAEYGRTAGGIVTIATKAGTNKFRGALYEYFQDRELNANGFVRNRNGLPRINVNRNQFGGAIGGPVFLPRFGEGTPILYNGKNKTFFFFNYEARREDNPFARELLTVPTAQQRTGNLSDLLGGNRTDILFGPNNPGGASGTPVRFGQIFNPFGALVPYLQVNANGTTTQVMGRPVIPNNNLATLPVCPNPRPAFTPTTTACLDPVALAVLSYIPQPNATGTQLANAPGVINNFIVSDTTKFTRDIFAGRIDQRISDKQNLFGRFSYEVRHDEFPNFFNSPASNARAIRDTFMNFTLNHVYTLTQNAVNNFRYGYTRVRANQRPNSQGFNPTTLGLPAYLAEGAANLQFPNFLIGGGADGSTLPGQLNSDTIGGAGNDQPRDVHTLNNSVSIVAGSHTIKTGGEYRLLRFYPFQFFSPTGNFTFDRTFTRGPVGTTSNTNVATSGSALATFLLGLPTQAQREAVAPITIYHHYYAGYVQDDWRINRKLVLNLGLRYDYETGTAETHRLVSSFDFEGRAPVQVPSAFVLDPAVTALNPGIRDLRGFLSFPEGAQTRTPKNRFAPRLGFAYSLNNKTTLRGGFGLFFLPQSLEPTTAQGVNFTTSAVQTPTTGQVTASTIFLTNPFPNGLTPV
ncbi:MAG TPA: TonB-dependent receptor, partial [Pyrinomonadaceae bacterium]|nr:TonB-dependent receptor [Pyrinomonadaceae bacterium]